MKKHDPSFADRLSEAGKAKRAQIEKARANAPTNDPGFSDRQAARLAVRVAREARVAERKAAKLAEKIREAEAQAAEEARKAEAQAAEEAAQAIALIAEQERRDAEVAEQAAREIAIAAERKQPEMLGMRLARHAKNNTYAPRHYARCDILAKRVSPQSPDQEILRLLWVKIRRRINTPEGRSRR